MKVKKVLSYFIFCTVLSFLFLVFNSLGIKAYSNEYCIINDVEYSLPTQIASTSYLVEDSTKRSLPLSEIYERVTEDEVTIHDIYGYPECMDFNIKYTKSYDPVNRTYTINNMILDTYEDGYWSYSKKDMYYENSTIWFNGSYYMESYYKTEIINNTNYTVYLNGEVYTPSTILEFNYEQTPILYIEIYNEYGVNVTNDMTLSNVEYEHNKVDKRFEISPHQNSDDMLIVCNEKSKVVSTFNIISFYNDAKSLDEILDTLVVSDNVDGNVHHSIVVTKDEYSTNERKVGTYFVDLYAQDEFGNKAYCTLKIYVVDIIAPIIDGPSTVYNYLSDIESIDNLVFSKFNIYDEHDGNLKDYVSIEYENYDQYTPGYYPITLSVRDSSNNITSFTFDICVVDDIPPVFTIDNNYYIYTSASEYLGIDEMVYVFIRDNIITTSYVSYEVCEDTYSSSYNQEGTYKVLLMFNYGDDIEYKEINVVVEKDEVTNSKKATNKFSYLWFIIPILLVVIIFKKFYKAIIN